ncbi:MAG: hypothetical protein HQK83_06625 [Fibrobacteria bacterium]|nr:hypothetical protein [Fibrobacteria bacterium]
MNTLLIKHPCRLLLLSVSCWILLTGCPKKDKHKIPVKNTPQTTHALPLDSLEAFSSVLTPSPWLKDFWSIPIPFQGNPPYHWTKEEKDISAEGCKSCHPHQFADWSRSMHAHSTKNGIIHQLSRDMHLPAHISKNCNQCHNPLVEQSIKTTNGKVNPAFNQTLYKEGVTCIGCHVRKRTYFGPAPDSSNTNQNKHNGFIIKNEFSSSAFCSPCHDLQPGNKKVNGKLLLETGEEWRRTRLSAAGMTCQKCHMPDKKHLFKGIRDSATVKEALSIQLVLKQRGERKAPFKGHPPLEGKDSIIAELAVTNLGAAHRVPTYINSQIRVILEQLDSSGNIIQSSVKTGIIGRKMSLDLKFEVFDTRLLPGEKFYLGYKLKRHPSTESLRGRIEVWPDQHNYELYKTFLNNPESKQSPSYQLIKKALNQAEISRYVLWEKKMRI